MRKLNILMLIALAFAFFVPMNKVSADVSQSSDCAVVGGNWEDGIGTAQSRWTFYQQDSEGAYGRHWNFYQDNGYLYYKSSADGVHWTKAYEVDTGDGYCFCTMWYDVVNNELHFIYNDTNYLYEECYGKTI